MVNVQVKRVPETLHAALKARARSRNISLNDLLLEMLDREMQRPSMHDWIARVRTLGIDADVDIDGVMDNVRGPWPT